nr:MAG TPA: hypothetical protein [Caudoviricetes sp.]
MLCIRATQKTANYEQVRNRRLTPPFLVYIHLLFIPPRRDLD